MGFFPPCTLCPWALVSFRLATRRPKAELVIWQNHSANFITWARWCEHGWAIAMPGCCMRKLIPSKQHLFSETSQLFHVGQTSNAITLVSSGVNRFVCDWKIVCSIVEQLLNNVCYWTLNKVWSNHWLTKNDFIATSSNYSTHLCLIAPCFVSMTLANIGIPAYSHCVVADAQS